MVKFMEWMPVHPLYNTNTRLVVFSMLLLAMLVMLMVGNIAFLFQPGTPIFVHLSNFGIWFFVLCFYFFCNRESRLRLSSNAINSLATILLILSFVDTGGLFSVDKLWLLFIICTSYLFAGIMSGLVFTLISLCTFVGYYIVESAGLWPHKDDIQITDKGYVLVTTFCVTIALSMVLMAFVKTMNTLQKKNDVLTQMQFDELNRLLGLKTKELEYVREEIARDFHDEMGNKLASISVLSQSIGVKLLNNEINAVQGMLETIENRSLELYQGTKDFIWSIRLQSDCVYELYIYLREFGETFFQELDIDFKSQTNLDAGETSKVTSAISRQAIYIVKELFTNAAKHSKCRVVGFKVYLDKDLGEISISVSDDGIGFDQSRIFTRGLATIFKRVDGVAGQLQINSKDGLGTYIQCVFKLVL